MKPNYEVRSASAFLNIEIPVKLNSISATIVHQLLIFKGENKIGFERDFVNTENVFYQGNEVKDYGKFMKFHHEMGIDINQVLYDKSVELFPDEECQKMADKMVFFKRLY